MLRKITKIGLVQNAPLTADFSANLRAIIQGYRDCLDHGAELVVAPSTALCGPNPQGLAYRKSFLAQTLAALSALSHELGEAPLVLGAYTILGDSTDDTNDDALNELMSDEMHLSGDNIPILVPYLIEKDTVSEMNEAEVEQVFGSTIYVDFGDDEVIPYAPSDVDLIIHLPSTPWSASSTDADDKKHLWEARNNDATVICVHPVGTAEGNIYPGGSAVYHKDGKILRRLPHFETASQVISLLKQTEALPLPPEEELLSLALERGIRDMVRNNGYSGVCIPLDLPNATLLAAICTHALGGTNVHGITFQHQTQAAKHLGITCREISTHELEKQALAAIDEDESPALLERLHGTLMSTLAENCGLMLLSPLTRRDIMLGNFALYGSTCGLLAPLGCLYEMDIHLLNQRYNDLYPDLLGSQMLPKHPEFDRIIHELADRNISGGALISSNPSLFRENDVRLIQRKLIASSLKRTQIPLVLHVEAEGERLTLPVSHRLND